MQWAEGRRFRVVAIAAILSGVCLIPLLGRDRRPHYDGHPLDHWISLLASDHYRDRSQAENALQGLGPEALPELRKALHAQDTWLGRKFRAVRDRWVQPAPTRVPAYRIRELAAERLWRLGRDAGPAAPDLVERLADTQGAVEKYAMLALESVGPEATSHLIEGLGDDNPDVRCGCAVLLGAIPLPQANLSEAVRQLTAALTDAVPRIRSAAATSLGSIGDSSVPVVTALGKALQDPEHHSVRRRAADGLAALGPGAVSAVPELRRALADNHEQVRLAAAVALWRITERTRESMPALLDLLRTSALRWQTAYRLGQMGPDAAAATPFLLRKLKSEVVHRPNRTPGTYALALSRMGPTAIPGLIEALSHENRSVRIQAAMALEGHGAAATPAVPRLREMLRTSDGGVRMAAAETLGTIGPDATVALPDLTRIAEESDSYLRAAALNAVNRIQLASAAPLD